MSHEAPQNNKSQRRDEYDFVPPNSGKSEEEDHFRGKPRLNDKHQREHPQHDHNQDHNRQKNAFDGVIQHQCSSNHVTGNPFIPVTGEDFGAVFGDTQLHPDDEVLGVAGERANRMMLDCRIFAADFDAAFGECQCRKRVAIGNFVAADAR